MRGEVLIYARARVRGIVLRNLAGATDKRMITLYATYLARRIDIAHDARARKAVLLFADTSWRVKPHFETDSQMEECIMYIYFADPATELFKLGSRRE